MSEISTPCVHVCRTGEDDRCLACGRTLAEIAAWGGMSETERLAVMMRLRAAGFPLRAPAPDHRGSP